MMTKTGPKPIDMTYRTWGRLTALEYVGNQNWLFQCDCGSEKTAWGPDVRRGKVQSCGCIHTELMSTGDLRRTHGACATPEYSSWNAMMTRCLNLDHPSSKEYGRRGITVCERWKTFELFLEDMGERPRGTTLDRIDVDGGYGPDNCRWADSETQAGNKRLTVRLTARGRTMTQEQWARELGCSAAVLRYRRGLGWDDERIIATPVRRRTSW